MGKKIKKFLKKAAKAAIIGGAIYGATKLAKNRKKKALNAITAGDIARPKNYQIPDTDMGGSPPVVKKDTIPNWAKKAEVQWKDRLKKRDKPSPLYNYTPNKTLEETLSGTNTRGYGKTFKKGGRVTGCAKRGFGRALKRK